MSKIRMILILGGLLLCGAMSAVSLDDFYMAVYNTDSPLTIEEAFTGLLTDSLKAGEVDNAVQLWTSYDPDACRDFIGKKYSRAQSDLGWGIAKVYAEADFAQAIRAAKKLIILHRTDPRAYQAMVTRYIYEYPESPEAEDWVGMQNMLLKDADYFYRFYELEPQNEMAVVGKLIASMAKRDVQSGKDIMDQIILYPVSIASKLDMMGLAKDPSYLQVMLYYLGQVTADDADPETLYSFAEAISTRYYQTQTWQEMINVFANRRDLHGLGLIAINLLSAYYEMGQLAAAKDLLAYQGVDSAVNLIYWWDYYYPERDSKDFVNAMHAMYSGDSIVDAVWLAILDDAQTKLVAARAYIEENPEIEVGYNVLFDGWRLTWRENLMVSADQDSLTLQFMDDLSYWDAFSVLNADAANKAIVAVMEGSYYAEKAANVIAMIGLRPGWIENPDMQFLLINSYFNLDDYASVMQRLYVMVDNGLVSLADLEGLESSGNAICEHEGWARLMDYARKLEDKKTVDEDQPEENR